MGCARLAHKRAHINEAGTHDVAAAINDSGARAHVCARHLGAQFDDDAIVGEDAAVFDPPGCRIEQARVDEGGG